MKITLNELRHLVKSVIKEQLSENVNYPLEVFIDNALQRTQGTWSIIKEDYFPNGTIILSTSNAPTKLYFYVTNKKLKFYNTISKKFEPTPVYANSSITNYLIQKYNKKYPNTRSTKDALYSELIRETPRFYDNEGEKSNTQTDRVLRIRTFMPDKDKSRVIIMTDNQGDYEFYCANNYIKSTALSGSLGQAASKFYNKAYTDKLKKYFCVKSAGGSDVLDVGTYSQTDQNAPVNVAESKVRKIIKNIIKEELF